jgi:hypothetical protein
MRRFGMRMPGCLGLPGGAGKGALPSRQMQRALRRVRLAVFTVTSRRSFRQRTLLGHSARFPSCSCVFLRFPPNEKARAASCAARAFSFAPRGTGRNGSTRLGFGGGAPGFFYLPVILSSPPMYGRSASGSTMLPSACWPFSSTATRVRPTARPEPFSVCRNSLFFAPLAL